MKTIKTILFIAILFLFQACSVETPNLETRRNLPQFPFPSNTKIGSELDDIIVIDSTANEKGLLSENEIEGILTAQSYITGKESLVFTQITSNQLIPAFLKTLVFDSVGNSELLRLDTLHVSSIRIPTVMMYLINVDNHRSIITSAVRGGDIHILSTTNHCYKATDINMFVNTIDVLYNRGRNLDASTIDSIAKDYLSGLNREATITHSDINIFKQCMWTLIGGGSPATTTSFTTYSQHLLQNTPDILLTHSNSQDHSEFAYNAAISIAQILCLEDYYGSITGYSGTFNSHDYLSGIHTSDLNNWVHNFYGTINSAANPQAAAFSILQNLGYVFSVANNIFDITGSIHNNHPVINTNNWTLIEGYEERIYSNHINICNLYEYKNYCTSANFECKSALYYDFSSLYILTSSSTNK